MNSATRPLMPLRHGGPPSMHCFILRRESHSQLADRGRRRAGGPPSINGGILWGGITFPAGRRGPPQSVREGGGMACAGGGRPGGAGSGRRENSAVCARVRARSCACVIARALARSWRFRSLLALRNARGWRSLADRQPSQNAASPGMGGGRGFFGMLWRHQGQAPAHAWSWEWQQMAVWRGYLSAAIAQLGERQTEDLKVTRFEPGSRQGIRKHWCEPVARCA
jgi:hypothetical protein